MKRSSTVPDDIEHYYEQVTPTDDAAAKSSKFLKFLSASSKKDRNARGLGKTELADQHENKQLSLSQRSQSSGAIHHDYQKINVAGITDRSYDVPRLIPTKEVYQPIKEVTDGDPDYQIPRLVEKGGSPAAEITSVPLHSANSDDNLIDNMSYEKTTIGLKEESSSNSEKKTNWRQVDYVFIALFVVAIIVGVVAIILSISALGSNRGICNQCPASFDTQIADLENHVSNAVDMSACVIQSAGSCVMSAIPSGSNATHVFCATNYTPYTQNDMYTDRVDCQVQGLTVDENPVSAYVDFDNITALLPQVRCTCLAFDITGAGAGECHVSITRCPFL